LTANLTLFIILLVAIPLVGAGKLDGVLLAVVSLVTLSSFEAVAPLPQAAQMLEASLDSARRLFELVDAEPAVSEPDAPSKPPVSADLSVRSLTFRYEAGLAPALQGADLELTPGRKVALVGPSGAGKSTLLALLMRFWDVPAGTVFIDGQDIRSYRSEDARRLFSLVSQTTYLFTATLRENLRLANPDAGAGDFERALDQAGLRDWFVRQPDGLDTWLGERGQQMSGGERQRLSLARALLQNAPVVLLDEPTAHLDPLTEREIIHTLHAVLKEQTVLWATHSLKGMEWMDEIVVLDRGQVVERGTHRQLMKLDGLYARMWRIQNEALPPDE
ncbi:amino acid ABC transporter ATP-binding/permease protein, partial [Longilinea arvoryzae]|uniref:amino acid ABC transporter ATP-binding/permease protein n=1 Tax=Longilinea arvoryzae TaxID=360412 RepID=UPI0015619706